jgi:hypothetical protein
MKKACLFIFGFATLLIFRHFGNIHLLQFRHYYSHPLKATYHSNWRTQVVNNIYLMCK